MSALIIKKSTKELFICVQLNIENSLTKRINLVIVHAQ
jgi:hypothetical protein